MNELLPYVEGKYKIAGGRNMRAIGGISMGGYGALNLALTFPDKFCAAALLSPAIYDPVPPKNSAAMSALQFFKEGKFDPALWMSLNYPARLDNYSKASQKVSMWIVSGDHDFFGIALQSAQLFWRLFQMQPKQVELRVIDGATTGRSGASPCPTLCATSTIFAGCRPTCRLMGNRECKHEAGEFKPVLTSAPGWGGNQPLCAGAQPDNDRKQRGLSEVARVV